jgi:Uma2 family endonuclease
MKAVTLVPVEEYLRTTYRPDCDYVDGEVLERNVGEKDHSKLQGELFYYLRARSEQWGIHIFPEQRVQISKRRFRIPDLCIVAGPEPEDQIFCEPPLVCIEVLSRDDTLERMQEKIDDFLGLGVRYVWVINPRSRRAWVYTSDSSREVKDGVLRTEDPTITVPLSEIFSRPKP